MMRLNSVLNSEGIEEFIGVFFFHVQISTPALGVIYHTNVMKVYNESLECYVSMFNYVRLFNYFQD